MVRMTFGVGVGLKADGSPMTFEVLRTVHAIKELSRRFGGCFVTRGKGGWMDAGELIEEPGLCFTCLSDTPVTKECGELAARWLQKEFKQKSVVFTWELVEVRYVGD